MRGKTIVGTHQSESDRLGLMVTGGTVTPEVRSDENPLIRDKLTHFRKTKLAYGKVWILICKNENHLLSHDRSFRSYFKKGIAVII